METNAERRSSTIELYNVLAFGWYMGHALRGAEGMPSMMDPEDLDRLCQTW